MQVGYKPGPKIKSARVVIEDKETSSSQVARPPTDKSMHSLLVRNEILNAPEITINVARANVLIDPCAVGADLMSAKCFHPHNIPTEKCHANPCLQQLKDPNLL